MVHLHYRLAKEVSFKYKPTRAVYKKLCNELRESSTTSDSRGSRKDRAYRVKMKIHF